MKDKNAPKGPSNAYTIFYKHFHSEFRKKNPQTNLGGQQLTQLVAEAWKSLSEEEKRVNSDMYRIQHLKRYPVTCFDFSPFKSVQRSIERNT